MKTGKNASNCISSRYIDKIIVICYGELFQQVVSTHEEMVMENYEVVEAIAGAISAMESQNVVYSDHNDRRYFIRCARIEYDWFIFIELGQKGGLKGEIYVLDQNQPIVADRLLTSRKFNPKEDSPFHGTLQTRTGYKLALWATEQCKGGRRQIGQLRHFVKEYLLSATRIINEAAADDLRSNIYCLEIPDATRRSVVALTGGLPGLGRKC